MKRICFLIIIMLVLSQTIEGKTRLDGVHNYLDGLRINDQGYSFDPIDQITVEATTKVVELSSTIGYEIKNSEDIILFYQNSQNPDFGFGNTPSSDSDFGSTVNAVSGLVKLGVNSSQMENWNIHKYVNSSAYDQLFADILDGNDTITVIGNFTIPILETWYNYIFTMFLLNSIPNLPYTELTSSLHDLQLPNGTYSSFENAVYSLRLLNILGSSPTNLDLASLFLQAYVQQDHLFSFNQIGPSTLKATYLALSVFKSYNLLEEIPHREKIILKILDQQQPNSGFSDLNSDEVSLDSTWYAIKILDILSAIEELFRPDVLQTDGFLSIQFVTIFSAFPIFILRRKHHA